MTQIRGRGCYSPCSRMAFDDGYARAVQDFELDVALEKGVGEPEEVALVVEEKKEDASNPGEVPVKNGEGTQDADVKAIE